MNQGLELHGLQGIWSAQGLGWAWGLVETVLRDREFPKWRWAPIDEVCLLGEIPD